MWDIVIPVILIAAVIVLAYFAFKGMNRLMKESEARIQSRNNCDAYIKHGFDPDEQEKRRIEENR